MALQFRPGRSDESPGRELLRELDDLFNAQYTGRAVSPGSVTTPDEMAPPQGIFLVGYQDERPIAIGGLRRLQDRICEIKRTSKPGATDRRYGTMDACAATTRSTIRALRVR